VSYLFSFRRDERSRDSIREETPARNRENRISAMQNPRRKRFSSSQRPSDVSLSLSLSLSENRDREIIINVHALHMRTGASKYSRASHKSRLCLEDDCWRIFKAIWLSINAALQCDFKMRPVASMLI